MVEKSLIVAYKGIFSQEVILELGEVLARDIALLENEQFSRKVFGVFIELSQNLKNYSAKKDASGSGQGRLRVFRDQTLYYLETCNRITPSERVVLKGRIQEINLMKADRLKQKYNQIRMFGKSVPGKGAGLGLIDIARRTGNPIRATFRKINENNLELVLKVSLKP